MNLEQRKGITLVALVITIVILLILAGISIQAITNQGIFAQADEAKKKTENSQIEEYEKLGDYENIIEEYVEGTREQIMVDKATYEQLLEDVASLKAQTKSSEFSTTTEKVVGTWIDGKPIYRKVIVTNLPTVTTQGTVAIKEIEHNISNIENIINISGTFVTSIGGFNPLNQSISGDAIVRTVADSSIILIQCSVTSFSNCEANVILEYTKTTDTETNN